MAVKSGITERGMDYETRGLEIVRMRTTEIEAV